MPLPECSFHIKVKPGLLLAPGWLAPTSQGKAVSGRETKTGLPKHPLRDPSRADPWVLRALPGSAHASLLEEPKKDTCLAMPLGKRSQRDVSC